MGGAGNLLGGLAQGFAGTLNQLQERQVQDDYKKALIEHSKVQTKLLESQINLKDQEQKLQGQLFNALGLGGGSPMGPQSAPMPQPQGIPQGIPQAQPGPQSLGREIPPPTGNPFAPMSAPAPGSVTIPGDPANNISVRQNNAFNIKGGADYPGAIGVGTRGFSIFPTPEAGVMAGIDLVRKYQSGSGPVPPGATIADMGAKYEGSTPENIQRWIGNVSKYLGVSPNTPIANIPLFDLSKAVVNAESSADITPLLNKINGSGLPQKIAQAQMPQPTMQAPGSQPGMGMSPQAIALDMLTHKFGGIDPKFRERGDVARSGTIMTPQGPAFTLFDKTGRPIQQYAAPPTYHFAPGTDAQGRPTIYPINANAPGGPTVVGNRPMEYAPATTPEGAQVQAVVPKNPQLGESFVSKPPAKDMLLTVPDAINQKIANEYDPMINAISGLKQYATQNKDVFGLRNQLKFAGAESPAIRSGMGAVGMNVSSDLIDFYKTLSRAQNLEVHAFGGSNLTAQELRRALTQLPQANNAKDFAVAADTVVRAYQNYKKSIYDFYSKPENQRTQEALALSQPPGAIQYRYNPQSGKLEAVQ